MIAKHEFPRQRGQDRQLLRRKALHHALEFHLRRLFNAAITQVISPRADEAVVGGGPCVTRPIIGVGELTVDIEKIMRWSDAAHESFHFVAGTASDGKL